MEKVKQWKTMEKVKQWKTMEKVKLMENWEEYLHYVKQAKTNFIIHRAIINHKGKTTQWKSEENRRKLISLRKLWEDSQLNH